MISAMTARDVVAAVELDRDVVRRALVRSQTFDEPALIMMMPASLASLHDGLVGAAEVRVHRVGALVDRGLKRLGGVGRVVEVEREVAGRHVGHRERRVDRLQAELEGQERLLLEAEVAAADERRPSSPPRSCISRPVA